MNLKTTFESLRAQLRALREAVSALQLTVTEDKPPGNEAALVDQFENTVCELLGTLQEAEDRAAALVANKSTVEPNEITAIGLRTIHALINRFAGSYLNDLAGHYQIARLVEMGREKGGAWPLWGRAVRMSIDSCASPLRATADAILQCWTELSERLARNSVSVHATNIGQQITVKEDQFELAGKAA